MWQQCLPAFSQQRSWELGGQLALSNLINFGRHTITGALGAGGRQDADWSAAYRLFERRRFAVEHLFDVPLKTVIAALPPEHPVIASVDDTLLRKTGKKVYGASWRRDPLGPKFTTNFVWSQRWLQISPALPEPDGRCRAIPVDFHHCPSAVKPGKNAGADELAEYVKRKKEMALPLRAKERIELLRTQIPSCRKLVISGDGGYTNRTVCRNFPANTTLLGRVRKDAKLFALPENINGCGRKRLYGKQLPTPENMRLDDSISWREVNAATGNKMHTFKIKSIAAVRSQITGQRDLKLIIIQPLRYRLTPKSKLLYRDPAYIISTVPELTDAEILQWYLWRWEIELNFRDEKNIPGVDEAMIRTPNAVASWAPFVVCSYAMLLLAGSYAAEGNKIQDSAPKWQKSTPPARPSTNHYLTAMRQEIYGLSSNNNLDGFKAHQQMSGKPLLFVPNIRTAILSARK